MAIGAFLARVVGFPLGLLSGYVGGKIDRVLVLVIDSIYAFPGLLLAALIAVVIGRGVFNIGIAITVIYVPLYFRVTRGQTLSTREELFVEAARALGARARTIMISYIAFSVVIVIPVIFSLSAADTILTSAGLSYLRDRPEIDIPGEWGSDLSGAQKIFTASFRVASLFPGFYLILLSVVFAFLGDGIN